MQIKDKVSKAALSLVLDKSLKYIKKDPDKNLPKYAGKILKIFNGLFPGKNLEGLKRGAADPNNAYTKLVKNVINDSDPHIIKTMALSLGYEAGLKGTKKVRENREKLNCNIPWIILFDPTSACNLHCKGCWAAEYGHELNLSMDEMRSIVKQGKELGTHVYMLTGGEPLIRKKDVIKLCEENQDCTFLAYTNATLIDQKFCDDLKRVGNMSLALSIEGTRDSNDDRRGEGAYEKTLAAMDLLKKNKIIFGISVCYTRANVDFVTSDEFLDLMVEKGVKFGFYFNYMPLGHGADKELIPSPAQRKYMYYWIRRVRNGRTGKPMFVFDFQDDGEFVGGCIAGGRNYFHINSRGDMEPCVFIHFSDSNIRTNTILEGLRNPLFTEYRKGQPFNDNHLRPCPMLENPEKLREIIHKTGAKSTDLIIEEDVDTLCGKCDEFAYEWKSVADEIWENNPHPKTHTQYYRDGGKSKIQ
ncbi:MAG: radical SAM protein [Clostridiales bacterium]|nr:radical SAM protein [Clostridiales bacterium]MCD7826965.1 radical SAM protein [Clostridiales bacterium]